MLFRSSRRGQPRARGHGAAALHGVVGAEDERHGVEQEDGRLGLVSHGTDFTVGSRQWTESDERETDTH